MIDNQCIKYAKYRVITNHYYRAWKLMKLLIFCINLIKCRPRYKFDLSFIESNNTIFIFNKTLKILLKLSKT
jgi:hypothetical protein